MNCSICRDKTSDKVCQCCKQMQASTEWLYELDEGTRRCKCPSCGGGLYIGLYAYENHYKYCPYCGRKNIHGKQIAMEWK